MLLGSLMADMVWYPILFDSPINIARGVAFWLTVALAVAVAVCALALKGDARKKALKCSLFGAVGYACALALMFLVWTFLDDGISVLAFVPLLILVAAIAGSAGFLAFRHDKTAWIVCGCIVGAALIASLVCLGVLYAREIADDGYYNSAETGSAVNQIVLYVSAVLLVAAVVALGFLFGRNDRKGFDSKAIAYAAICIAMSFALSYVRIFKLPQGGSVTVASLLPLMVYSYMFGTKKGVFAGLIYGILQAVQDPYIIHPAQFMLDYPIAFSAIGLAGMFSKVKALDGVPQVQFLLGGIAAGALRYVSHVISGVFAFSAYAVDAGMAAWPYSLAYNSFVFADIAIALVVGVILFCSKEFVRQARKFNQKQEPSASAQQDAQ